MEPRLLILETSGRVGQVATAVGPAVLACRRLDEGRRHARDLAPAVGDLLAEAGWRPHDVHAIIVSRGPGSYTGLRVGIMSAKTFAYATGCALIAVDTFAAIALQAPAEAMTLDVIADAQQDKVYVQRFGRTMAGAELQPVRPLSIETVAEWVPRIEADTWVTGPGLNRYRDRLPGKGSQTPATDWDPRAASLLSIGLARYQAGERDDPWTLEPTYLRPSSAEEKWASKKEGKPEGS